MQLIKVKEVKENELPGARNSAASATNCVTSYTTVLAVVLALDKHNGQVTK